MTEFTEWRSLVDGERISAIPDSVVLQYFATEVDGGDAAWPDDKGTENMTLTGGESNEALSDGAEALGFDGNDDKGLIDVPDDFDGDGLEAFSLEIAFETTDTGRNRLFGCRNDDGNQRIELLINADENFNEDEGRLSFRLSDGNASDLRAATNDISINDGNRKDVTVIVEDSTQNDLSIIVDGADESLTFGAQDNPDNFGTWDRDIGVMARSRDGTDDLHVDGSVGAIRWHDETNDKQTIGDYE